MSQYLHMKKRLQIADAMIPNNSVFIPDSQKIPIIIISLNNIYSRVIEHFLFKNN